MLYSFKQLKCYVIIFCLRVLLNAYMPKIGLIRLLTNYNAMVPVLILCSSQKRKVFPVN